jgi:hypothetical protein
MTLVALNELYNLGIGIKGLAENIPFWDTNACHPKKEIIYINPSLAHNSTVFDDLTL